MKANRMKSGTVSTRPAPPILRPKLLSPLHQSAIDFLSETLLWFGVRGAAGMNSRRAPNNPGGIAMNKPTAHRLLPFLIAAGLCLLASLALAQRSPKKHNQPSEQPPVYDATKK